MLDWIQNNLRCSAFDFLMPKFSFIGDMGLIWIIIMILLLLFKRTRKLGLAVFAAMLLEIIIVNLIIKPSVTRIRPCDINTAVELLIERPNDFSFPSGHTGMAFAFVGALIFEKCKWWIPSAVLASLIAFSRMYLYVHYPSDILAGIIIGIVCAYAGIKLIKTIKLHRHKLQ